MDPQKLPEEIDKLRSLRKAVADRNQSLAERELESRRLHIDLPDTDEQYLAHRRDSIRIAYERDVLNAEAEAVRLGIELGIEQLKALFAGAEQ